MPLQPGDDLLAVDLSGLGQHDSTLAALADAGRIVDASC
jgi:hypothetical protein